MARPGLHAAVLAAGLAAACSRRDVEPADVETPFAAATPDAALATMEKRTAADPRDHLSPTTLAELRLRRAVLDGDVAQYRLAEAAARTALEREPGHVPAKAALARALCGGGRGEEAGRMLVDVLDAQPRHVGALAAAFDVAFAAGDVRRAQTYADRLLAINEAPETLRCLGLLAERRGDAAGAAALFRRAVRGASSLGGMPDEIEEYRRLETRAAGAAKAATK